MYELFPKITLKPKRAIRGMSAVLLPYQNDGRIAWNEFEHHLERTFQNGLVPAVNMDTGFGNLLSDEEKLTVLSLTYRIAAGRDFVAGVFIGDQPGDELNAQAYLNRIEPILQYSAIPILFPSYGVASSQESQLFEFFETIARYAPRFLGF